MATLDLNVKRGKNVEIAWRMALEDYVTVYHPPADAKTEAGSLVRAAGVALERLREYEEGRQMTRRGVIYADKEGSLHQRTYERDFHVIPTMPSVDLFPVCIITIEGRLVVDVRPVLAVNEEDGGDD